MIGLLLIGFLAGAIAGISPCILPILPVVLVGWSAPVEDVERPLRARRRRALAVVAGLVVSFSLITALGSVILSSLGLPLDLLRTVGIVLLILFGVGLLVPRLETLLERPFRRMTVRAPKGTGSGFVLGLGLGLVFVPCAGPVLAAISVLGATHHATLYSVALSFFFGVGAAGPLFAIALAGDRLIENNRRLKQRARRLRPVAGVLLIAIALAINFNAVEFVQRWVPTYTNVLQQRVEGNSYTVKALRSLSHHQSSHGSLLACESTAATVPASSLQECGKAPAFSGITDWLNTPRGNSLSLSDLKGRVVLVDFWTYSCINCQRTLPHLEAWYTRYHKYGLDIIGVESPEFAFEHVLSNIRAGAKSVGVNYPVAVDDNLATWTAYSNQYWPAEYLVGANGVIRHVDYGEGNYTQTESFIRQLLKSGDPSLILPPATNVANLTPTQAISPETYLGFERSQYLLGGTLLKNARANYQFPSPMLVGRYGLSGTWLSTSQAITSVAHAQLDINFQAHDVYLVLGGSGTVRETLNGKSLGSVTVTGFPTLYTLVKRTSDVVGLLNLQFTPGVRAYDFTFG